MQSLKKKILISLHGIRTRGEWQKEMCPVISAAGWKYYPLDYDWFHAHQLAIPFFHGPMIDWFRRRYGEICAQNPEAVPSIIVHSFGSLILTKALLQSKGLKFDRIILTGAIAKRNFPWDNLIQQGQVAAVLNLVGKKDTWPLVASCLFWIKAGSSGRNGIKGQRLVKEVSGEYSHGGAHFNDVYTAQVLPFLEDATLKTNAPKANYLTHVNPYEAACWTAVMYIRQFIERFYRSIGTNDFYFRRGKTPEEYPRLIKPPIGLVIVVPDDPSYAKPMARGDFEKSFRFEPIAFSSKARSASLSDDWYAYDLPSALENFNVYTESAGSSEAAVESSKAFREIIEHAISMTYSGYSNPPIVKSLQNIENERRENV